jgi:hypothetical protein
MTTEKWEITAGPEEVEPSDTDAALFRWTVENGDETRSVIVAISGTLMATASEAMTTPIDVIVATKGRAAVLDTISKGRVPRRITVSSSGIFEDISE